MIGGPIGWPIGGVIAAGNTGSLAVTLDAVTISATGALALKGELTKTLDDATISAVGAIAIKAAASITAADATISASGAVTLKGTLTAALDDAAMFAAGALAIKAALAVTLDDVVYEIHGGPELTITDTEVLELPVDCVLAGDQPYSERGREYEIRPRNIRETPRTMKSRVGRLGGDRPNFTTRTGSRGYD